MAIALKTDILARVNNVLNFDIANSGKWLRDQLPSRKKPDLPELMCFFSRLLTREQVAAWAELQDRGWQFHAVKDPESENPIVVIQAPDDDTLRVFRPDGFVDFFSVVEMDWPGLEVAEKSGHEEQGDG